VEFESEKSETKQKTPKLASKNHTPSTGVPECSHKKQQTKTTKHTIEFSNNRPSFCPFQGNPTSLLQRWLRSQIAGSVPIFAGPGLADDDNA
jgi:hypothetical protein